VDESTYQGRISVPLGPIALGFAGLMKFEELDAANHTARVTAQGVEAKGSGDARATAFFRLEPENGGCKVLVHMELMLSGAIAQYGSAGSIIQKTAAEVINQFAANLRAQVSGAPGQSPQGFGGTGNDRSQTATR
jgi:carbon monoxide dehydrogenase subunit G